MNKEEGFDLFVQREKLAAALQEVNAKLNELLREDDAKEAGDK